MNKVQLAKLLIEGPRIISEETLDPITRAVQVAGTPDAGTTDAGTTDAGDRNEKAKVDKKITVYLNRASLRLFSMPSLLSFWKDTVLFNDTGASDGRCKIQWVFQRLPDEAYPMLVKLLAAPRTPKFTRFVDKGQARTGVEVEVTPDDFGGEDYDYAF